MSFASDGLTNSGNEATAAPAYLSRSKAVVESTFRRINGYIKEVPGYEPQWNVNRRRRKPYEAKACVTFSQLEGLLLRAIISMNREVLKNYPQSSEDTKSGLLPIPCELWVRGVERLRTLPRRVSRKWLRSNLLSKEQAQVTQTGIRFMNNYYTCQEGIDKDWFSLAAINGSFPVNVMYTPKNLEQILVEDPSRKELHYVANLTSKSKHISGDLYVLTEDRARENAEQRRQVRRVAEEVNNAERMGFIQYKNSFVTAAEASMRTSTKGVSLQSRKQMAEEIRETEAHQARQTNHVVLEDGIQEPDGLETSAQEEREEVFGDEHHSMRAHNALADPNLTDEFFEEFDKS